MNEIKIRSQTVVVRLLLFISTFFYGIELCQITILAIIVKYMIAILPQFIEMPAATLTAYQHRHIKFLG